MRLIDADKLIDHLEKVKNESASLVDMAHIIGFQSVIDAQTTAYDADKVVEQLDKVSDYYEFDEQGMEHVQMLRLVDAIEIVKGGGVDGN